MINMLSKIYSRLSLNPEIFLIARRPSFKCLLGLTTQQCSGKWYGLWISSGWYHAQFAGYLSLIARLFREEPALSISKLDIRVMLGGPLQNFHSFLHFYIFSLRGAADYRITSHPLKWNQTKSSSAGIFVCMTYKGHALEDSSYFEFIAIKHTQINPSLTEVVLPQIFF